MHTLISLMEFERKHFDLYPETVFRWKAFFSNAGIKDRAEEYAKLFVDKRLVHNKTNALFGRINRYIFSA